MEKAQLVLQIESIIDTLNDIKGEITDQNCDQFVVDLTQSRKIGNVYKGRKIVKFRQESSLNLDISIKDLRKEGEILW